MINIHSYDNNSGIYGIYIDNVLVYIGKASSFHQRFGGHMYSMRHSNSQWYPLAREFDKRGHNIDARIIEKIPVRAMREKELEYINNLQPIFNIEGCPKGRQRPTAYDEAVSILGIIPKPPVIEIKIEEPQNNWFGEEIKFRKW